MSGAMRVHIIILLCATSALYLATLLAERWVRRASSPLFPTARRYALSLTVAIYDYLCGGQAESPLLTLTPTMRERVALAEVVASLSRGIVECDPERVRTLSRAWGLEEVLTDRALHRKGRVGLRALNDLVALHPSEECVGQIARKYYPSSTHSLAQLRLVVYSSPALIVPLLARHPHTLSWHDVGSLVEVLKMHSPTLEGITREGDEGVNVDMLWLYLAAVEGVGEPVRVARECSESADVGLRTAALNVLFGEQLFPTPPQGDIGS